MCYHTVFDKVIISIRSSFNYKANRKYNSTITLRPLGAFNKILLSFPGDD